MSGQFPFGFTPPDPEDPDSTGGQNPFGGGFDMSQMGAMLESLGRMMQSPQNQGPVNWSMAHSLARQKITAEGERPLSPGDPSRVDDAVRLAELWLDEHTNFPEPSTESRAWTRSQWLDGTLDAWKGFIEPIAEQASGTMNQMLPGLGGGDLPPELRSMLPEGVNLSEMLGPLMGMARQMGATMFAMQAGDGLGSLAADVFGASDIGVPLTDGGQPTLVPQNVDAFADGLGIPSDQVMLFLALREAAHQRLFTHVPWLRARLLGAVEEYARGIDVDLDRISESVADIDPADPQALQEVLASGVFEPQDTPEQEAAKARLETLLALVEGWVDAVVAASAEGRLPALSPLREAMRRRRAAGGPAERTFATLFGLEMRPRRLREASAFWQEAAEAGADDRDRLWAHPDLLPSADDLADPSAFFAEGQWELPADLGAGPDAAEEADDPDEEGDSPR